MHEVPGTGVARMESKIVSAERREMAQHLEYADYDLASRISTGGFMRMSPEEMPSRTVALRILMLEVKHRPLLTIWRLGKRSDRERRGQSRGPIHVLEPPGEYRSRIVSQRE